MPGACGGRGSIESPIHKVMDGCDLPCGPSANVSSAAGHCIILQHPLVLYMTTQNTSKHEVVNMWLSPFFREFSEDQVATVFSLAISRKTVSKSNHRLIPHNKSTTLGLASENGLPNKGIKY